MAGGGDVGGVDRGRAPDPGTAGIDDASGGRGNVDGEFGELGGAADVNGELEMCALVLFCFVYKWGVMCSMKGRV